MTTQSHTHELTHNVQQGKDDIETRYQSSIPNQTYTFPRHISSATSSDISLERLEETDIYNLYTQNPHTSTTNTHASSSSDKDTSNEDQEPENKHSDQPGDTGSLKKAAQPKVVSLGPIELLSLYKKTLTTYRDDTEEDYRPSKVNSNRPESLTGSESHKKYGSLIMKIVKSKKGKEKSLQEVYGTKQKMLGSLYGKERRVSKKGRHQKNVSKEVSEFSQDLLNVLKGELGEGNGKSVCVNETVSLNPTTMVRRSVEKKSQNSGSVVVQGEQVKEKERHVKNKPSGKMINIHSEYKTAGTRQTVRAKATVQGEVLKKVETRESSKPQEKNVKCVKTVEIVKGTGQIREVRESAKGKTEEKTREATRERTIEKPVEVKVPVKKQVSAVAAQVTERLSTLKSNKPDMGSLRKSETLKVSVNGKKKEDVKEQRERKKLVADAVAVAKILDLAKTMPVVKLDGEKEEKKKWVKTEEECEEVEVLEPCENGVFDSPVYKKMEPRKMALNLHVVTQSVVKEYEARQRRREQTKKKMMEVRKYF